jgi:hypothetical protein
MEDLKSSNIESIKKACSKIKKHTKAMTFDDVRELVGGIEQMLGAITLLHAEITRIVNLQHKHYHKCKEMLALSAVQCTLSLEKMAKDTGNIPLMAMSRMSESHLKNLSDKDLHSRSKAILALVDQHNEKLRKFGLKDKAKAQLEDCIRSFVGALEAKKEGGIQVKTNLSQIKKLTDKASSQLQKLHEKLEKHGIKSRAAKSAVC